MEISVVIWVTIVMGWSQICIIMYMYYVDGDIGVIYRYVLFMYADLKITTGHWPFSVQYCQTANHFPKWLALLADHQRNYVNSQRNML